MISHNNKNFLEIIKLLPINHLELNKFTCVKAEISEILTNRPYLQTLSIDNLDLNNMDNFQEFFHSIKSSKVLTKVKLTGKGMVPIRIFYLAPMFCQNLTSLKINDLSSSHIFANDYFTEE